MPKSNLNGKWSRKFDQCIKCKTEGKSGRNKHFCRGLCKRCYYKQLRSQPGYRQKERIREIKSRQKIKNDPILRQRWALQQKEWRAKSEAYKYQYRLRKLRQRYDKYIVDYFEKPDKYIQKRNRGLVIAFEFEDREVKMRTPLIDVMSSKENLEYFRKRLFNYLIKKDGKFTG